MGTRVRYRLNRRDPLGTPDVYVSRLRLAISVNRCFCHGHDCARGRRPATNEGFWNAKIDRIRARDSAVVISLAAAEVACLTVWQCTMRDIDHATETIAERYQGDGRA